MAAITPVDENCNPLRNAILYGIDTRCTAQAQALTTQIGPERMNRIFGGPCTVEHFGPKILWIKENEPEVYRDVYKRQKQARGSVPGTLLGVLLLQFITGNLIMLGIPSYYQQAV